MCLRAEPFAIGLLHAVANRKQIFHDKHGILRQELQEGLLTPCPLPHQLRHNGDALLTVAAELAVHLEGAYAVHLVAKEVDAVRQFMREGIDVDDAAAHSELPRLIDIIGLVEAKAEQHLLHEHNVNMLPHIEGQRLFAKFLFRHNQFAKRLRIGHDEQAPSLLPL